MVYYNEENEKKRKPRSYYYAFVTYENPANFPELFDGFSNYAYIKHDDPEDLLTSETKSEHWHILVRYANQRYESAMFALARRASLKGHQNVFVERVGSACDMYLYLTHEDPKSRAEDRVTYSSESVSCYDKSFWNDILKDGTSTHFSMSAFLRDLFSKTPMEMAMSYGRDYIKNRKNYNEFKREMLDAYDGDIDAILAEIDGQSVAFFDLTSAEDLS